MKFTKGQSGNPGGRPKGETQLIALARSHSTRAVKRLVEIMEGDDLNTAVRAAMIILDRGWGKPKQTIEGIAGGTPVPVTVRWEN